MDYPRRSKRFELNYNLLSVRYSLRMVVKNCIGEWDELFTVTILYRSAGWLEREV